MMYILGVTGTRSYRLLIEIPNEHLSRHDFETMRSWGTRRILGCSKKAAYWRHGKTIPILVFCDCDDLWALSEQDTFDNLPQGMPHSCQFSPWTCAERTLLYGIKIENQGIFCFQEVMRHLLHMLFKELMNTESGQIWGRKRWELDCVVHRSPTRRSWQHLCWSKSKIMLCPKIHSRSSPYRKIPLNRSTRFEYFLIQITLQL